MTPVASIRRTAENEWMVDVDSTFLLCFFIALVLIGCH